MKNPSIFLAPALFPVALLLSLQRSVALSYIMLGIFAAALVLSLIFLKQNRKIFAVVLCSAVIIMSGVCIFRFSAVNEAKMLKGETVFAEAVIHSSAKTDEYGRNYLEVRDKAVTSGKIRLFTEAEDTDVFAVGDILKGNITFLYGDNPSNEQIANGITAVGFLSGDFEVEKAGRLPVSCFFDGLAKKTAENLSLYIGGDEGAAAAAMLTGMDLPQCDLLEDTRSAGVSHYFCVSGFHLSVICGIAVFFMMLLNANGKITFAVTSLLALSVALFAGMTPSVLRAAFMAITFSSSGLFMRTADLKSTLAFTASVFLTVNPPAVLSASFLLSYSAVAGIALSFGMMSFFLKKIKTSPARKNAVMLVLSPIFISLFAAVGTSFASVFVFGWFPLYSVFSNVILSPVINLLFILLIPTALLSSFPFASPLIVVSRLLLGFVGDFSSVVADFPSARLYSPPVVYLIFALLVMIFLFLLLKKRKPTVILSAAAVLATGFFLFSGNLQGGTVSVFSLFDGSAVILSSGGEELLFVTGEDCDISTITHGRPASDFAAAVKGETVYADYGQITDAETFPFGSGTVSAYRHGGKTAILYEDENRSVLILPDGFPLKEIYKTAIYDIIIVEGDFVDTDYLLLSNATEIIAVNQTVGGQITTVRVCETLGATPHFIYFGENITMKIYGE